MKKNILKITSMILVLACLMALLTACGGGNPTSLSGQYVSEGNTSFSYIEFFSDGKYTSSHPNYEGDYSIDGNRIRLEGILVDSKIYYFKASGDTLELSYDEDFENSDVYKKQ